MRALTYFYSLAKCEALSKRCKTPLYIQHSVNHAFIPWTFANIFQVKILYLIFRALKFIGPFVLMIYTILSRDLSRFFMIYSIFLIGFSQGSLFTD